jgi:hypothetical protein
MLAMAVLLTGRDALAQTVFDNSANVVTDGPGGGPVVVAQQGANQFGDEIVLDPGAANANAVVVPGVSTNVVLTNFTFEYYANETTYTKLTPIISNWVHVVGTKTVTTPVTIGYTTNFSYPAWTVDLRFYASGGQAYGSNYTAPGALLFDSAPQTETGIAASGPTHRHTLSFNSVNKGLPASGVLVPLDLIWTVQFGGAALYSTNSFGLTMYTNPVVGGDYPDYWQNTNSGSSTAWVDMASSSAIDFGAVAQAGVNDASEIPTVAIVSPANKFDSVGNPTVTVTGTAALVSKVQNNYIAQVLWRLNGGDWTPATLAAGATKSNWTASVTLPTDLGAGYGTTNLFEVETIDAAAHVSLIASHTFVYQSLQTATINVNGNGLVKFGTSTNFPGTLSLIVGKTYTITATQPTDNSYYFSNVVYSYLDVNGNPVTGNTGSSTGANANTLTYTFVMETNETLTFNFPTNRFFAAAGTYNGLFYNATTGPDMTSAGYFTLTVNADKLRSYTATLTFPRFTAKLTSKVYFNLDGSATYQFGTTNITFQLPLSGDNDTVTGTVVDTGGAPVNSVLLGDRQMPTAVAPWAGKYTMVLPGAIGNANQWPIGDSSATLTVDGTKGTATFGNLFFGANTPKQLVPIVSTNGDLPFYAADGDDLIIGWLKLDTNNPDGLANKLTWVHDSIGAGEKLTSAFTYQTNIIASPFVAATPVVAFTNTPATALFGVPGFTSTNVNIVADATGKNAGGLDPIIYTAASKWLTNFSYDYATNIVKGNPVVTKTATNIVSIVVTATTNIPVGYGLTFTTAATKIQADGHVTGSVNDTTDFGAGLGAKGVQSFGGVVLQNQHAVRGGFVGGSDFGFVLMQ